MQYEYYSCPSRGGTGMSLKATVAFVVLTRSAGTGLVNLGSQFAVHMTKWDCRLIRITSKIEKKKYKKILIYFLNLLFILK